VDGQGAVTHLSSFLSLVTSIHVARHVDIDGISQGSGQSPTNELYAQTVDNARLLVRTLEAAVQSLYDDGSALLLAIQSLRNSKMNQQPQDKDSLQEYLESLVASSKSNLRVVQQTLEQLLSLGHNQADMAQGDYNGSIEWRMSRLSVIDNQFGGARRKFLPKPYDSEGEDVVDIEHAFRPPESKVQDNGDVAQPLSQASESASDHSPPDNAQAETFDPSKSDLSDALNRETNSSPFFDDDGASPAGFDVSLALKP